ncbi:hypothetical protein BN2537_16581 [Streptomyces venezuelae]|nr:hypothetical protein BN2537_16581 [Streptomyces venezuelae]
MPIDGRAHETGSAPYAFLVSVQIHRLPLVHCEFPSSVATNRMADRTEAELVMSVPAPEGVRLRLRSRWLCW